MRSVSLTILALGGLCWLGCSSQSTAPASEPSWSWVRLHEGGDASYSDFSVGANGEFVLDKGSRGGESPARGLLAGERLETLARLIGDLPLELYSSPGPCDREFFLTVTRNGTVSTYRTHECDENEPPSIAALRDFLSGFADQIDDPQRPDPDAARVLSAGTSSAITKGLERVIENRDELISLLRQHRPTGIEVLPAVDFRNEVVVAIFGGERESDGYGLDLGAVESGDNGWLTIQIVATEPGRRCDVAGVRTQPFLLLAVARPHGGGFVLDRRLEVRRCGL